jgi:5-methylthioadenosine/S-adenosylhomocysteine deaminase
MNHTTIISARWIVTVNGDFDVLSDSSIVMLNERIDEIVPNSELTGREDLAGATRIELGNHVLMPGLVNAHTHAAMSLMRGIADDLPLMDWLQNHIWPAESKWVDRAFIRDGIALAAAEMLRGGTTCFNDMYFFPDDMARTCQKFGIRAVAGLIVLDFPTIWAKDGDDYLSKALAVNDELKELPLVTCALAPHAPYTVSDGPLEKVAMYSSELDLPVHMHVHETQHEVDEAIKHNGKRPLERLDQLGLLNPNLVAVHMTALNDLEIERIAETGVSVAHCPESNMKLASGFCPVHDLSKRGINVCLGTDGAASNNDLDMFGEMRSAALLAKAVAGNASAINAQQAIRMATINGARALGLGDSIGSIEPGKKADLIAIDLSHLATQPVYDPVAQLVYAANSQQVSHVWVDGVSRVADYHLADDIDTHDIIARAQQWQHKIQRNS